MTLNNDLFAIFCVLTYLAKPLPILKQGAFCSPVLRQIFFIIKVTNVLPFCLLGQPSIHSLGALIPVKNHTIQPLNDYCVCRVIEQGCLFAEREAGRRAALYQAFDGVRSEFGHGALVSGRALHLKGRLAEDQHGFVLRTPSLTQ